MTLKNRSRIYAKVCKSTYNKDTCIPLFITALFTTPTLWNQPRCPTTNDWIKKMWYIHIMEYNSAIKKNEIMSFAGTWMELDITTLSKISQTQKGKYCMFHSYVESRPKK
jgi:hypothetical protein